ncbi:glycosyltransferase family 2 protein [Xylanibacillus composti]|uniref:Glycosyl transferase n=1 Tax=Xylanibacillus composti TaxID=1572762 RepID=A0A8J4H6K1_9BACL|nr:glycosyltransferase family 2 protein [Xylanibacillus composti]MDT9726646.1 glycosyltransferase family 2 protein [Xylanibacillus composti]GIQ69423.1 glycosyl transferase [Xylanibacillus composti]
MQQVSVIIPAWNEGARISVTLEALHQANRFRKWYHELLVVDDGSTDETPRAAGKWADTVIRHTTNRGKGAALESGWRHSAGHIVVFLDADLGESAAFAHLLLEPIRQEQADMCIAKLPAAGRKGGFGLVKGLATTGITRLGGFRPEAPLSGQRAVRREVLESVGSLARGFGIEVGLTIDALRKGYRVCEAKVPFRHRETGRDWSGFVHRGKQFYAVGVTLMQKWRERSC